MSAENTITKENLDFYLRELAKEYRKLNGTKVKAEIILVGGAAVLANYGFREMTVDIDATKTWKDSNGNTVNGTILNASITFKLQQSTDGENWTDVTTRAEEPNPRTLSNEDTALTEWKISWTSLPKYAGDTQIQYKVVETAASVIGDALVSAARRESRLDTSLLPSSRQYRSGL